MPAGVGIANVLCKQCRQPVILPPPHGKAKREPDLLLRSVRFIAFVVGVVGSIIFANLVIPDSGKSVNVLAWRLMIGFLGLLITSWVVFSKKPIT